MRCLMINSNDVFFNSAVEEYFIKEFNEPIFMLWKNTPNVMVGRNQNTVSEVNEKFCKENNIDIIRRLSGGGAIYNSLENFEYTLIIDKLSNSNYSFKSIVEPLIDFLKQLGIDAQFTGRNDVLVDGKKISGNAQYHFKDILLQHGTVLYDVDINTLMKCLTPDLMKLTAKGIKSVKSRVTTLKERLPDDYNVDKFMDEFMKFNLNRSNENYYKELTEDEKIEVLKLKEDRWDKKEWNFGKNPKYSNKKKRKFTSGLVEINYEIKAGKIFNLKIYGDFFATDDISKLEDKLLNKYFEKEIIIEVLKDIKISNYIDGVNNDEFIELLFE